MTDLKKKYKEFDDFELVPEEDCVWLWGYGEYPKGSVLAGQFRQARLDCMKTVEEAKKKYPGVEVRDDGTVNFSSSQINSVPHMPPSDFDPMDAGEVWDENDY